MEYVTRHPRIMDSVITPWGDRGTIVLRRAGYSHIDSGDDLRLTVGEDRLRWDPILLAWIVLAPELPEPAWLHDDHPADATVESEYAR